MIHSMLLAGTFALVSAPQDSALSGFNLLRQPVVVRSRPARYSVTTLLTGRLSLGTLDTILPAGARVMRGETRLVGADRLWQEVVYIAGRDTVRGWVYADQLRRSLMNDSTAHPQPPPASSRDSSVRRPSRLIPLMLTMQGPTDSQAVRQGLVPSGIDEGARVSPVGRLLILAGYVAIFLAALIVSKKWVFPDCNKCNLGVALCVLLILGFLSQTVFVGLFEQALT